VHRRPRPSECALARDDTRAHASTQFIQDAQRTEDTARLRDGHSGEPAIHYVDDMIRMAVEHRASDIHMEPGPHGAVIRQRIDGELSPGHNVPSGIGPELVARIKVLAKLDVAEKRLPQDGRFRMAVAGRPVDLRVSLLPTLFGEGMVLRVLDKTQQVRNITALGLSTHIAKNLHALSIHRNGLVLVSGPTGSGKTTTLYTLLHERARTPGKLF
jgi:general secretion pathway protein E